MSDRTIPQLPEPIREATTISLSFDFPNVEEVASNRRCTGSNSPRCAA
jgi:hypothetical protein